jgi:signal transduction histidine kinase
VPALGFTPALRMEGLLDTDVPPESAADALAALCEALSNVARHAHATAAEVVLRVGAQGDAGPVLTLTVTDNGRGLPVTLRRSGLHNLTQRADHHGGSLTLEPGPTSGTRLTWQTPLHRD